MLKRFRTWLVAALASASLFFGWQFVSAAAGLTWVAPTQNTDGSSLTDLSVYRVYRRSSATAGSYTLLATVPAPATSYTDSATLEGVNCYTVTAVDDDGNESVPSNQACKTIDTIRPSPPTALTVN